MQQIIVIIIGIVVFGIIVRKLYNLFKGKPSKQNRCAGCDIDCALRDLQKDNCDKNILK